MVAEAGGYIHIVIAMMYQVKTPKRFYFVHHQMNQPTAEVQCQHPDKYGKNHIGIKPVHQAKRIFETPVRQQHNYDSQQRMNE